ncbi:abortive infection system antitoxin AbiGi family protein [Vibrio parahaemolyticus]|uniref:abortive infection system antitoxin AbiGi family protein n=1 Tax=Vibrio parahaemolyticus TaxID=670 RepID=UPI00215C2BF9|nr:abortive infection system antitoxin AbiGi family protein [Vibrio parahaemolyticus]MCR9953402.1 abortive infection system antitoxin AbiGi family protein [Vibrio parahaemolyticus]
MKPKSHTLFHFTKSRDTLKLILKNGFWPRYCLEDVEWMKVGNTKFAAFPMVCFCDIPLSRVDEHVKFYGEFGIGLTKEWAVKNGLSPIQYVSSNSDVPSAYQKLINVLSSNTDTMSGWDYLRYLTSYCKPIEGNMVIDGKIVEKEFIQESEWRFIASNNEGMAEFLSHSNFDNEEKLSEANQKTLQNNQLKFNANDIKYIFVKQDSDIPDIINFIQSELDFYLSSDLKVLMSRVISLESIVADL